MRNTIQLKQAQSVEPGEHILTPQHASGILLAHKVVKTEAVDGGKWIELTTDELDGRRIHMVAGGDVVVLVV